MSDLWDIRDSDKAAQAAADRAAIREAPHTALLLHADLGFLYTMPCDTFTFRWLSLIHLYPIWPPQDVHEHVWIDPEDDE